MIIVADQNIPLLEQTFGRHARLKLLPGRAIGTADLVDARALLTRSVTLAGPALLEGSGVGFVGSATIGIDHLDTAWLESRGIAWAHAPGCNANAAAEYSLAMVLLACERAGRPLAGLRAGIVGRGNVGSRHLRLLQALGAECVACDPPLAEQGETGLVPLERALECDLVCLHVPLTRTGPHPTWRMIDGKALSRMPDGALLLNTARGDVVDGDALLNELRRGRIGAALDVWPGEPEPDTELLERCLVATPHVAGYSVQGRQAGTLMIYDAFRNWRGLEPEAATFEEPAAKPIRLKGGGDPVTAAVLKASGVMADDRAMRKIVPSSADRSALFDRLRREYPPRNEFRYWSVSGVAPAERNLLRAIGLATG